MVCLLNEECHLDFRVVAVLECLVQSRHQICVVYDRLGLCHRGCHERKLEHRVELGLFGVQAVDLGGGEVEGVERLRNAITSVIASIYREYCT